LLVISAVLFALALLMERNDESRAASPAIAHQEAGEAGESGEHAEATHSDAGESGEQAEGNHTEAAEAGAENGHREEMLLGFNLENPWLVWGFVGVSILLALAVLRFGKPAFLFAILLAGVAALLDVREVFFQMGLANMQIAGLALVIALLHAAASVLAFMGWRSLQSQS
jgi:hypothetical protein